jgi:prepilin peptidase CpaA
MLGEYFQYGLLIALAIALLFAAFTDIRHRHIDNWLNAGIALGAPLFWWASGMSFWPDVMIQFAAAFGVFIILAGLFALRAMGGGDVKLLTALALWLPFSQYFELLLMMALVGGVLTIVMGGWHIMRRQKERLMIPYGVAISSAGLWVLSVHYLPPASQAIGLG